MRTLGDLFARLITPEHLGAALRATSRGKRRRPDVAWLLFRREEVLAQLGRELAAARWQPHGFDLLFIRDPKPRVIARAPVEDRIVHAALVLLLEPTFERSLTDDAYACRPGYGTHRARLRLLEAMRRHRFFVHLDVRSYFASVDLGILRDLLARRIRDVPFLRVVDEVLEVGEGLHDAFGVRAHARMDPDWPPRGGGLPIGALTSQLFAAHVYLSELDHFVKRVLRVPAYLRYVDDLVLFGRGRAEVRGFRDAVVEWLWDRRRLRLKSPRARVRSCAGHLEALGKRVTRAGIEPFRRTRHGSRAVVAREVRRGDRERGVDFRRSFASIVGDVLHEV